MSRATSGFSPISFREFKASHQRKGGFTLVEVTICIGILAVAFFPLLGMMLVGVNEAKQSIDITVTDQIVQELTGQVQQTGFSQIATLETSYTTAPQPNSGPFYFDDQGYKLSSSVGAIYEAGFHVATTTALPSGVSSPKLATVTISILSITSGRTSHVSDLLKNPDARKYTELVPDNGL